MKILIAADLHYPTINGIATFSRNLARGLAQLGHEVMVIAPSQSGKATVEKDGNYTIVRTKAIPFVFYQNFRISPRPTKEVRKVIDEFKPDVIHVQVAMFIGMAAMKYGNELGVPIVSSNHTMPENTLDNIQFLAPVADQISAWLYRFALRFYAETDYMTMPTQSAIDHFHIEGKLDIPVEPVSNGIDLSRFEPTAPKPALYKKFGIPKNKKVVAYVGRLDKEKHLPVLVRAFKKLQKDVDGLHLLIVGDGTDRHNLERIVHHEKLKNVTITGRVTDDEIVQLHKVGTVFCMPSPAELQSIATLEAMASGQPVVAIKAGALAELCQDGRNGYICEKDDVEGIASALKKILADDTLRQRFSKQSLAIAHTHDLQTTIKRYEAIYLSLIKA